MMVETREVAAIATAAARSDSEELLACPAWVNDMNPVDIVNIRLRNHQVKDSKCGAAQEVVAWMGAMQAQDYAMAKWAIGVRLPGSTHRVIEAAIDAGEIIRTHLLRPTWHFVSADDIYWMLALTAPRIKAGLKSRHQELGLDDTVVGKSNATLEKALRGGKHLTREELVAELGKAKIPTNDNRASHLLSRAELDGIVCSGATKGGKQTYALLQERVPKTKSLTQEEALDKLAYKYFASRGPATLQDFVWWSGLPMSEARRALEMVKGRLISETSHTQTLWFTDGVSTSDTKSVYLLPAFDEFIIGYRDRSAALPLENHNKAVSDNGIFRPIIVVNGQVMGIWKRTINKPTVIVETELFQPPHRTTTNLIEKAAVHYGHFLGKQAEISYTF
jgi:hypothetical protein